MGAGLEVILGYLADRLGLDLRDKSAARRVVIVALYSILGLLLLIGGIAIILANLDSGALIFSGAACALLGAGYLVRTAINIIAVRRQSRA